MKYKVSAVVEKEDNEYVSHCVELEVTSQGSTIEEALNNLKEAVSLYIKHAEEDELEHLKKVQEVSPIMTTIMVQ